MNIDLEAVPFRETRYPGVSIHFYDSDRSTGRAAVLIRMQPGAAYPRHRHIGPEELLVLQGGMRDHQRVLHAGDHARFEAGTSHRPIALDGDTACVFFALAYEGIEILEEPPEPTRQESD